jgi:hypothetical protein
LYILCLIFCFSGWTVCHSFWMSAEWMSLNASLKPTCCTYWVTRSVEKQRPNKTCIRMGSKCILQYLSTTTVVIDETTISVKRHYCNTRVRWKIFYASGIVHNFKPVSLKQKMGTLFIENNMSDTSVLFSCEGPYQPKYYNVPSWYPQVYPTLQNAYILKSHQVTHSCFLLTNFPCKNGKVLYLEDQHPVMSKFQPFWS